MGPQLNAATDANERVVPQDAPAEASIPVMPWLDERTAALVRAIVASVAARHPDLRAAILFGSVARHEERPLDSPHPSDVDLLLLLDLEPSLTDIPLEPRLAIFHSVGLAEERFPYPPREVQIILADSTLSGWDAAFVMNVARDGWLLWAREPLPTALAPVSERARRAGCEVGA